MPSMSERDYCMCRRFVTSYFLIEGRAYSRSFCRFFGVITVNIFSSVNKQNDANFTRWTFLSNCFEWLSLAWKFASLTFESLRFLSKNVFRNSLATHLRYGGIFMVALCNRAGHYIFALWFLLLSSFFLFSSPNLSRRRLDVYRSFTHGVALVRI